MKVWLSRRLRQLQRLLLPPLLHLLPLLRPGLPVLLVLLLLLRLQYLLRQQHLWPQLP